MKAEELAKELMNYPDFDVEFYFDFAYMPMRFPNIISFNNVEVIDIDHSNKVIVLTGRRK